MPHIFISYAHEDLDLANRIVDALANNAVDTWINWKSIPKGEDWEQEIYRGIEEADAFLFLISPDSVASQMCNKEIAHAVKNGKRILPILLRDTDLKIIHPEISKRNWIFYRDGQDDFNKAVEEIQTTIHTDYEWLKYHTKLQLKALDWERQKDNGLLLRGKGLREAEIKLTEVAAQKDPQPTKVQRGFVLFSRKNEEKVQRQIRLGLIASLIIFASLAIFAWLQKNTAASAADARSTAQIEAEQQAQLAISRQLAAQALSEKKLDLGLLLAVEAVNKKNTVEAHNSLLSKLQESPSLVTILRGSKSEIVSLAISHDGRILASGNRENSILLWDVSNPESARLLRNPIQTPNIWNLAFSPRGDILATANTELILWDVSDPNSPVQFGAPLTYQKNGMWAIAFSPDGRFLFSNTDGTGVSIWDIETPQFPLLVKTFEPGHTNSVRSMAFSLDGRLFATGSYDGTVHLWDVTDPQQPSLISKLLPAQEKGIYALAFSQDNKILVSATWDDNIVTVWDISTPQAPVVSFADLPDEGINVNNIAMSPTENYLAVSTLENEIDLWNIEPPTIPYLVSSPLAAYTGSTPGLAEGPLVFSPSGRILASSKGNNILLWDISFPQFLHSIGQVLAGHTEGVRKVLFSPVSPVLASASDDTTIKLWDVSDPSLPVLLSTLHGHTDGVLSLSFNSEGNILASGSKDTSVRLWTIADPKSAREIGAPILGHTDEVLAIAFSLDDKLLATGSRDNTVRLWDVSSLEKPKPLSPPITGLINGVFSLAISPNGMLLAVGSDDVRLLDISNPVSPRLLGEPFGRSISVYSVEFSKDGKILVTGNGDNTIQFWDVSNPETPTLTAPPLQLHSSPVHTVAFSRDGIMMASASWDGTVRLLDVSKAPVPLGSPFRSFPINVFSSLSFSSDNTLLAADGPQSTILLWNIDVAYWQNKACTIASRNLSKSEWTQYFPDKPYHLTCPQWPAGE